MTCTSCITDFGRAFACVPPDCECTHKQQQYTSPVAGTPCQEWHWSQFCILIADCHQQMMSPGFCPGCNRQQQISRGAGRRLGGSLDLAAFQLQSIADLEQELQHQAEGDQCCTGLLCSPQLKSNTCCPNARSCSLSAHAVEMPAMSDRKHTSFAGEKMTTAGTAPQALQHCTS